MTAFRADPENADRIHRPVRRSDEIGTAERELATMQGRAGLDAAPEEPAGRRSASRFQSIHDLRNLLASAQLFSDPGCPKLTDPGVQRFAPKLMRALERAIALCQSTAVLWPRPGGAAGAPRNPARAAGRGGARKRWGLGADAPIRWISAVERGADREADYDQLFRILLNLAAQCGAGGWTAATRAIPAATRIRITGRREGAVVVIEVSDTGPGFSEKARAHLFEAFQGSTRTGSAGLGLAIAAELVRAHGGEIRLVEGTIGATLRVTIPDRAVELSAHRGARAHG